MSVNHTQPDVIRQTRVHRVEAEEARERRQDAFNHKGTGGKGDSEEEGSEKENILFGDYSTDVTVKMTIVILLHILKCCCYLFNVY